MRNSLLVALSLSLLPVAAWAGRGSSNAQLQAAIASGSTDAIVSEVERAEKLACVACIDTVMPLLDHADAKVRDVAAWWLIRRGVRDQVQTDAVARLKGRDAALALHAADTLGRIAGSASVAALGQYLGAPLDEASAVAAASALGRLGDPTALAALVGALNAQAAKVRAAAVTAVRALRNPTGAAAQIAAALGDADEEVRAQAVYTLGALADRAAVAPLMTTVSRDLSPSVRKHAAWALGQLGDTTATPALDSATADPDPQVRAMARAALARLR
jgi:HEAT repeat protein